MRPSSILILDDDFFNEANKFMEENKLVWDNVSQRLRSLKNGRYVRNPF